MKAIAVFGGTFDPIHQGHLQSAVALQQRLNFDEVRMLPCHRPPHRDTPGVSSEHRLAMVRLACEGTALVVDDREMRRSGPSFSVETLEQYRSELGEDVSLSWVMGTDAFCGLDTWHRWQELLSLAHIVVIARPGESLPENGPVAEFFQRHADDDEALIATTRGAIVSVTLDPYPISATEIRAALQKGRPVDSVLPASVVDYIQSHQLYRST